MTIPNPMNLSDEDLAELTPDELEGMKDDFNDKIPSVADDGTIPNLDIAKPESPFADEKDVRDIDALEKSASESTDDEIADPDALAAELAAKADTDAAAAEAAAAVEAAANAPEPVAFVELPVEAYKAKDRLSEIETNLSDIDKKLEDGDLTMTEWRTQERALRSEWQQVTTVAESYESKSAEWSQTIIPAFFTNHPEYDDPDSILYKMLDAAVRKQQIASGQQFDPNHLNRAHAEIVAAINKATGNKPAPKAETTPAAKPKVELKPREAAPPTLANVAAAGAEEILDGKQAVFARISRLGGEAYENEVAKLSPADRAEFEQSSY